MTIATATVKGGFFEVNGVSSLVSVSGEAGQRRLASLALERRGLLVLRRLMRALNGVAPGALASETRARVQATVELGGARPIEQEVLINRNTTAADTTEIQNTILEHSLNNTFGANPPPNLDRNPLGTR